MHSGGRKNSVHKKLKLKLMLLGIPAAAGFIVFYIYPFIKSVGYSFFENTFTNKFMGFENYKSVITNEFFRMAVKNTIIFSFIGVIAVMLLAFVLSVGLVKLSQRFSFIRSAFIVPYVLPTASIIFIWQMIFNSDRYLALTEIESLSGFFEVLPLYILFVWKNVGIDIILITAALSKLPQDIFEAAALDGASGLKMHLKITLPLISPSLFFVLVLSFVNSLKIFKESYLFYNTNYPPDTAYMIQNYMNNHFYKLNYQNLSTAVTLFTIVVAIVIFLIYKLVNKVSE